MSEEEEQPDYKMSEEDAQQYQWSLANQSALFPQVSPLYNVHKFLHDVSTALDTTKTGNVSEEELGLASFNVRTLKDVQAYCNMMGKKHYADYFSQKSENITATSLSKDGFLDKLAVLTRQEQRLAELKTRKKNKGWFGKKNKSQQPEVTDLD